MLTQSVHPNTQTPVYGVSPVRPADCADTHLGTLKEILFSTDINYDLSTSCFARSITFPAPEDLKEHLREHHTHEWTDHRNKAELLTITLPTPPACLCSDTGCHDVIDRCPGIRQLAMILARADMQLIVPSRPERSVLGHIYCAM